MVARPSTSSDYLSLAKKTLDPHHHDHHASRRGCSEAVNESYGYLFTGLALILPVLRWHAHSQTSRHDGGDGIGHGDRTGGLVIATKKKRDKKGKGRAIDETSGQGSPANGLTGGDMIVLVRQGLRNLLQRETSSLILLSVITLFLPISFSNVKRST